jgi:hypothetical protein
VATARKNKRVETARRSSIGTSLGNAPPAEASTKHGATSALPGRRRGQKQELHTTYGHTATHSRRHQETASHQWYRLPPSDAADPLKLLRRRSRHRTSGIDRNPDEDRRGQTLEPPSIQASGSQRPQRHVIPTQRVIEATGNSTQQTQSGNSQHMEIDSDNEA